MDLMMHKYDSYLMEFSSWILTIHIPSWVNIRLNNYPSILPCQQGDSNNIELWYDPDLNGTYRREFDNIVSGLESVIPDVINEFYNSLEEENVSFLPPEKHINRYYYSDGIWYIDFPYATDRFFIICNPNKKTVHLYGKPTCLERVLTDLFAITRKRLPLHGSAVSKNGKAICFLGNSNSGKSSIILKLLEKGYSFIADDLLLIDNRTVYSTESSYGVCIIKDNTISKSVIDLSETQFNREESAKIEQIYCLNDRFGNPFLQWFPCVAKQSFWWLLLAPADSSLREYIKTLVFDSVSHLNAILADASFVTLESLMNHFE